MIPIITNNKTFIHDSKHNNEMETIELNSINATSHNTDNVKIILLHSTVFF